MEKGKKNIMSEDFCKNLAKLLDDSLDLVFAGKFSQSLDILKTVEKRMEKTVNKGVAVDKDLILLTLHTISLCLQNLGSFSECCTYLEACIFNVKKDVEKPNSQSGKPDKIRKIRFLCLLQLQLCDCLDRQGLHKQASENAKLAFKYSQLATRLCLSACAELKCQKPRPLIKSQDHLSNSLNTLQVLYTILNGKKAKKDCQIFAIRSALGVQKVPDWVLSLKFEKILEIKPLSLAELKSVHSLKTELSKEFLSDKICLSIACLFKLSQSCFKQVGEAQKAKKYLWRSLKLCSSFFPKTCPIFQALSKEYKQKYNKIKTPKNPTRSSSAKFSQKMQEDLAKGQRVKENSKGFLDLSLDNDTGITKSSQTESNSTINELKLEKTEPEPALSEGAKGEGLGKCEMLSKDLHGNYLEDEVDKYEYMPLRRDF